MGVPNGQTYSTVMFCYFAEVRLVNPYRPRTGDSRVTLRSAKAGRKSSASSGTHKTNGEGKNHSSFLGMVNGTQFEKVCYGHCDHILINANSTLILLHSNKCVFSLHVFGVPES